MQYASRPELSCFLSGCDQNCHVSSRETRHFRGTVTICLIPRCFPLQGCLEVVGGVPRDGELDEQQLLWSTDLSTTTKSGLCSVSATSGGSVPPFILRPLRSANISMPSFFFCTMVLRRWERTELWRKVNLSRDLGHALSRCPRVQVALRCTPP